jgi:hypothetical protein
MSPDPAAAAQHRDLVDQASIDEAAQVHVPGGAGDMAHSVRKQAYFINHHTSGWATLAYALVVLKGKQP